jgi:hypothetical protein
MARRAADFQPFVAQPLKRPAAETLDALRQVGPIFERPTGRTLVEYGARFRGPNAFDGNQCGLIGDIDVDGRNGVTLRRGESGGNEPM